jgi:hypothetical protein
VACYQAVDWNLRLRRNEGADDLLETKAAGDALNWTTHFSALQSDLTGLSVPYVGGTDIIRLRGWCNPRGFYAFQTRQRPDLLRVTRYGDT